MSDARSEIDREAEELDQIDEASSEDVLEDVEQDSVGPIEGDEAIDDDTPYKHTPHPPTVR